MYLNEQWSIHPEVQRLFEKYKDEMYLWYPNTEYNEDDKRFYVYIWFTKDEGKIFYVGKGTGKRMFHITKEIERYEKNEKFYKASKYKLIKDIHGIDFKIILDGVSDFEAQIYEFCMMREYVAQGEVLLNLADMPCDEVENESQSVIEKHPLYERYFEDYTNPEFDSVSISSLKSTYFSIPAYLKSDFLKECEKIALWIESTGGKVYKSKGKSVKSVIVLGTYFYEKYLEDHDAGREVYSLNDVINYIENEKH